MPPFSLLQMGSGILCIGHAIHTVPFNLESTWLCRLGFRRWVAALFQAGSIWRWGPSLFLHRGQSDGQVLPLQSRATRDLSSLGTCSARSARAVEVGWGGVEEMGRRVALRMEVESSWEGEWMAGAPAMWTRIFSDRSAPFGTPCFSPVWDYFLHCTFCMHASLVS